jgi:osmotically-inducible protein OsmY
MANSNYPRERFGAQGRERFEGSRGRRPDDRNPSYDYPDWDRYGGRGRDRYAAGDREAWQTDDLGYGEGYREPRYRESYDYRGATDYWEDRERGFARRSYTDDRDYSRKRPLIDRASDEVASWFGDEAAEHRRQMDQHRGKGPKGYVRTDERIREDVNDRLADDPLLDASDIEVTVSGGEVTLNGFVTDRQDKRRAEDLADAVSGVSNVQNNLRVKPRDVANIVS